MKKTIVKIVIGLVSFLIGLFVGVYGTFSYIEKHIESVESVESFDGEYIVKMVTEINNLHLNVGVIKVKGDIVSYDHIIKGVRQMTGKYTYQIKDNKRVFLNGVESGFIKENPDVKGDFSMLLNFYGQEYPLLLEKRL
tara:strand:- start:584 stop:997 length:414 start_codon:yes stop_codon:yes gene_type:complete